MGTKNNPGKFDCYAKAEPDEPLFVLLARDPLAPVLVDLWVVMRGIANQGDLLSVAEARKIIEAKDVAEAMREWAKARRGVDAMSEGL